MNCFQIGGSVSGDSFIGRKELISKYKKDYLYGSNRVGRSLVGLTRVGKTSFSEAVFSDVPKNILVIKHDLKLSNNYYGLWKKICIKISGFIKANCIVDPYLEILLEEIKKSTDMEWVEFEENIIDIFDRLRALKIRTIMVLDEFDYAEDLFENKTHYFELFRSLFADHNISSLLISRRQLCSIEKTTYQSSTFHGVLETVYFCGFNDRDMDEYYEVFRSSGIDLSIDQREEIEYYAGRLPFLLSTIGYYVFEAMEGGEAIDIPRIFENKCKNINDYYRDCIQHLERDNDLRRVIPFVVGPNIGVSKKDKDELKNLGYFREDGDRLIAISDYFSAFFSANMISVDIWDNIISLEKKLKQIIERELTRIVRHYSAVGQSLNEVLLCILEKTPGIDKGDIARYNAFLHNNKKVFNIDSSYLDVMSMNDTIKIIKECWVDVFSVYFDNSLFCDWETRFNKCSRARNPIAHGHEEYLSDLDKNEVDTYCKQFFDVLSISFSSTTLDPVPFLEVAELNSAKESLEDMGSDELDKELIEIEIDNGVVENAPDHSSKDIIDKSLIGQTVNMHIVKIGGVKHNNLKGLVERQYKAVITKNYLLNQDLTELINQDIKVVIERINNDQYEVRPIF